MAELSPQRISHLYISLQLSWEKFNNNKHETSVLFTHQKKKVEILPLPASAADPCVKGKQTKALGSMHSTDGGAAPFMWTQSSVEIKGQGPKARSIILSWDSISETDQVGKGPKIDVLCAAPQNRVWTWLSSWGQNCRAKCWEFSGYFETLLYPGDNLREKLCSHLQHKWPSFLQSRWFL